MTINWYGEGCFRLQFKEATILTDPLDAEVSGLKPTRIKVDITIKTLVGLPLKRDLKEKEFLLCTAGEYEIKNIFIKGKTIKEAEKLTKNDIIKALGGELPVQKIHCSLLGVEALKKAIQDYKKKR